MEISLSDAQAALGDPLNLTLTPLDSSKTISFTASIIEVFSPITKSLVVHIRILESSASLPATAVLKLYDPRFTNERLPLGESLKDISVGIEHPWSLDLEVASVQRREAIRRGELEDDFSEYAWITANPIQWEEHLYRLLKCRFESELGAYSRCGALQGNGMARCFGSGVLHSDSSRLIKPPFILLEYIPGTPLPLVDVTTITKPLIYMLLNTIITYTSLGVIHNDPGPANIFFSPPSPSAPTRAVLLDFGEAMIRNADESDEEWKESVTFVDDWFGVTGFLIHAGVQGVPRRYNGLVPVFPDIAAATLSLKDAGSGEESE